MTEAPYEQFFVGKCTFLTAVGNHFRYKTPRQFEHCITVIPDELVVIRHDIIAKLFRWTKIAR